MLIVSFDELTEPLMGSIVFAGLYNEKDL